MSGNGFVRIGTVDGKKRRGRIHIRLTSGELRPGQMVRFDRADSSNMTFMTSESDFEDSCDPGEVVLHVPFNIQAGMPVFTPGSD